MTGHSRSGNRVPRKLHLRALEACQHGVVGVLLYDTAAIHPVDPVGHEHGGHAVGSDDHRLLLRQSRHNSSVNLRRVSMSSPEPTSSSTMMGGSAGKARASTTCCRCPRESILLPSLTF